MASKVITDFHNRVTSLAGSLLESILTKVTNCFKLFQVRLFFSSMKEIIIFR